MADLKPCPFCGHPQPQVTCDSSGLSAKFDPDDESHEVECGKCYGYAWGENRANAIATWNMRTDADPAQLKGGK
jgi:hypothetical protein